MAVSGLQFYCRYQIIEWVRWWVWGARGDWPATPTSPVRSCRRTTAHGELGEEGRYLDGKTLGKGFLASLQTLSNNSFSWHFPMPLTCLFYHPFYRGEMAGLEPLNKSDSGRDLRSPVFNPLGSSHYALKVFFFSLFWGLAEPVDSISFIQQVLESAPGIRASGWG